MNGCTNALEPACGQEREREVERDGAVSLKAVERIECAPDRAGVFTGIDHSKTELHERLSVDSAGDEVENGSAVGATQRAERGDRERRGSMSAYTAPKHAGV